MTKNLYLLFLSTVLLLGFQSSIEERLYTLNRDLMCPVCDGLTLEQSQAAPALEMKDEIKKMVIQGMSDKEIKEHFVQKYGSSLARTSIFWFFWNSFSVQIYFFLNSIQNEYKTFR